MKYIKKYTLIILASIFYAYAINGILDPNMLAPGGITGVAIMLDYLTRGTEVYIETGIWIFILNIPIMLVGFFAFGWKFFVSTETAVITVSIASRLMASVEPLTHNMMLSAIIGGTLMGIGMGVVFRMGATTGGVDVIVRIIKSKLPHMKVGSIFLTADTIIVILSGFVFKNVDVVLYAAITVAICTTVMDKVIYGGNGGKLAFIISDKKDIIMKRLLLELSVGATILEGKGAYREKRVEILMCAVRRQQLPQTVGIVREEDEGAFMIVSSANEIFGEGFQTTNMF